MIKIIVVCLFGACGGHGHRVFIDVPKVAPIPCEMIHPKVIETVNGRVTCW
jgi:hypothetical protein